MKEDQLMLETDEYLPLREVVFNILRQAIITGQFKPGERLMEISLAKSLGVSRTPVREAIRMLDQEGLVDMVPRKGAQVSRITEKNLRDIVEIRTVLEEYAVGVSCHRISDEDLNTLTAIHRDFIRIVSEGDEQKIAQQDERFHDALFQAAGNKRLLSILCNLREQFFRFRLEYIKDMNQRSVLIREHTELIDAIRNRDEGRARQIMHEHLMNLQNAVLDKIKQDEPVNKGGDPL